MSSIAVSSDCAEPAARAAALSFVSSPFLFLPLSWHRSSQTLHLSIPLLPTCRVVLVASLRRVREIGMSLNVSECHNSGLVRVLVLADRTTVEPQATVCPRRAFGTLSEHLHKRSHASSTSDLGADGTGHHATRRCWHCLASFPSPKPRSRRSRKVRPGALLLSVSGKAVFQVKRGILRVESSFAQDAWPRSRYDPINSTQAPVSWNSAAKLRYLCEAEAARLCLFPDSRSAASG